MLIHSTLVGSALTRLCALGMALGAHFQVKSPLWWKAELQKGGETDADGQEWKCKTGRLYLPRSHHFQMCSRTSYSSRESDTEFILNCLPTAEVSLPYFHEWPPQNVVEGGEARKWMENAAPLQ